MYDKMLHKADYETDWIPLPVAAWDGKDVRIMEDGTVVAEIYLVQDFSTGILDVLKAMGDWHFLEFGRLCNVFMGEDEDRILAQIHRLKYKQ